MDKSSWDQNASQKSQGELTELAARGRCDACKDTRVCAPTLLPISSASSRSVSLFHPSERKLDDFWALLVIGRTLDKESEKVKEGAQGCRRRRRGEQEKEGFSVSTRELKRFYWSEEIS